MYLSFSAVLKSSKIHYDEDPKDDSVYGLSENETANFTTTTPTTEAPTEMPLTIKVKAPTHSLTKTSDNHCM